MAAATNTTNIGLSSPGEEREKLDRLLKLFDNSSVFALKDNKVIGILHFYQSKNCQVSVCYSWSVFVRVMSPMWVIKGDNQVIFVHTKE